MLPYDLIVIGSGPGGQRAAIQGAKAGKRVAVVEKQQSMGGVCINTGTIPSKTMREAVMHLSGFYSKSFYGSNYNVKDHVTMADLNFRVQRVIENMQVYRARLGSDSRLLIEADLRRGG